MLDYSRYGFKMQSEVNGLHLYLAELQGETLELRVLGDTHTLKITSRDIMVANRYKVTDNSQLDFILINGRAGVLFSSFGGSQHI